MPEFEHRHVSANGIEFHVATTGPTNGPPVLLLHGFPEGWLVWRNVAAALPNARLYLPDLRGYPGSSQPEGDYDVFTLTDDIKALIDVLRIDKPLLVGDDWGGELGWIFAHRFSSSIRGFVAVNGPHPQTLLRACLRFEDWQPLRLPWIPLFQVPWLPELFLTSLPGRFVLKQSFLLREGRKGAMDRALLDELLARYRTAHDMRGPVNYYRAFIKTWFNPQERKRLEAVYEVPIEVPITVVWGMKDEALSARVARKSGEDAGREIDWRPLDDVGHFVSLEAPADLAREIERVLAAVAA